MERYLRGEDGGWEWCEKEGWEERLESAQSCEMLAVWSGWGKGV